MRQIQVAGCVADCLCGGLGSVIAPVLALMLARRDTALVQVVPQALLEMTRSVLRDTFSSLLRKPVYTFAFDRSICLPVSSSASLCFSVCLCLDVSLSLRLWTRHDRSRSRM